MGTLSSFWRVGVVFLTLLANVLIFITAREDFYLLLGLITGLFWLYLLIIEEFEVKQVFILAVVLRLFWVFAPPTLSDDYHRFLWDGEVTLSGLNVYEHLPSDLIDEGEFHNSLSQELYDYMNSPDYFTVYPPVNQLYFTLSGVFSDSVYGRLLTLKILFFLTEFLGLFILFKFAAQWDLSSSKFALWALNPLVILEGIGNLHFEVIMLTFVLLAVLYFHRKWWLSAVFLGVAVSIKLLPVMFLPLLIPHFGWAKSVRYGLVAGGVFLVSFLPFFSPDVALKMWSSIDLYFQSFEFNASIFYIVKWIGELVVGWDIIQTAGPVMAVITTVLIGILSFTPKRIIPLEFPLRLLIISTFYLLMSTTVHPWYVLIPFGISLFTKIKYPLWWTFLAFLSYSSYLNGTISEKPIFLWLEYGVLVGLIVREVVISRNRVSSE